MPGGFTSRSMARMATPPTISATATTIGAAEHRLDLVDQQRSRAPPRAGRRRATLRTKRHDSRLALEQADQHRPEGPPVEHDHREDRAELDDDVEHRPLSRRRSRAARAARIRWPVEETGMNSVTPSTMPRRMMVIRIEFHCRLSSSAVSKAAGLREAAVAAVEGQPALGDRGERRGADAERLEAGQPPSATLSLLQHQPLVPGDRRAGQPAGQPRDQPADRIGDLDDRLGCGRSPGRSSR